VCVRGGVKKKFVLVLSLVFCFVGRARPSGALPLFRFNLFCTRCHVTKLHHTHHHLHLRFATGSMADPWPAIFRVQGDFIHSTTHRVAYLLLPWRPWLWILWDVRDFKNVCYKMWLKTTHIEFISRRILFWDLHRLLKSLTWLVSAYFRPSRLRIAQCAAPHRNEYEFYNFDRYNNIIMRDTIRSNVVRPMSSNCAAVVNRFCRETQWIPAHDIIRTRIPILS